MYEDLIQLPNNKSLQGFKTLEGMERKKYIYKL